MEIPSLDAWLAEAKRDANADQCGMYLFHNGVVRATPKAQVRNGIEGLSDVVRMEFSYDSEGLAAAVEDAKTWPGIFYVRVWLNEGTLEVGDTIMLVLIGADIRPRCVDALNRLVGYIKDNLVIEKEVSA